MESPKSAKRKPTGSIRPIDEVRLTMPSVPTAVTAADCWPPADRTKHPCDYWPGELATPHRIVSYDGPDISITRPGAMRTAAIRSARST